MDDQRKGDGACRVCKGNEVMIDVPIFEGVLALSLCGRLNLGVVVFAETA